jgi:uncharacterized protein DUF3313
MSSLVHRSFESLVRIAFVSVAYLFPVVAIAGLPPTFEGLTKVPSKRLAAVYLLAGADFSGYTKVMIDPVQVSFRPGWQKDINMQRRGTGKISDSDAQEIAKAARTGFEDIFAKTFKAKGYDVVATPGPDVLRLSPSVVNLYLNAPDPMGSGATRTYTVRAGEATLSLEARDSTTGALLGVAVDRRDTRSTPYMNVTTSGSNRAEFEMLFKQWADICVKGLEELKTRPQARGKAQ